MLNSTKNINYRFFFLIFFSYGMLNAQYFQDAPWMQEKEKEKQSEIKKNNFYDIQKAFKAYWKKRDPNKKGSGYKPFKRWEYVWEDIVDLEGHIPTIKDKWNA